jgi:DNA-binding transcriptional regulator YdaS (Cro superfamily)
MEATAMRRTSVLTPEEAMKLALVNAGGVRAVAKVFDVATQNIYRWRVCPPERVLKIEELSGVPRHELRPDLYPPEEYAGLKRRRRTADLK